GIRPCFSGTTAIAIGSPVGQQFDVETVLWGASGGRQTLSTRESSTQVWVRSKLSGGWAEFKRVNLSESGGGPSIVRSSGHKVIPLILTAGNSGSSSCPATGTVAYPLNWVAPINRFRVVIA